MAPYITDRRTALIGQIRRKRPHIHQCLPAGLRGRLDLGEGFFSVSTSRMGNFHSSWLGRRHPDPDDDSAGRSPGLGESGGEAGIGPLGVAPPDGLLAGDSSGSMQPSEGNHHPHSLPYELRRTLSRIRRRMASRGRAEPPVAGASPIGRSTGDVLEASQQRNSSTFLPTAAVDANGAVRLASRDNASTASLNSRRRRTPEPDGEVPVEAALESEPRRARIESVVNTSAMMQDSADLGSGGNDGRSSPLTPLPPAETPEGEMPIYFYFRLQGDGSPSSSEGEATPSSLQSSSPTATPTRRRSTRLAQAAANFFRNPFSAASTSRQGTPPAEPSDPQVSMTDDPTVLSGDSASHTLVLVRIQRVAGTPPPTAAGGEETRGGAATAAPSEGENGGGQTPMLQWTLYLLVPRTGAAAGEGSTDSATAQPPPTFDPDQTIARAVAIMRALMMGDNMSYEEWMRLQEVLGTVSRGVSKERVEECCASREFSDQLGIGLACPICLAEYVVREPVRTLPCQHSYHAECIDTWLGSRNNCPLCRQPPVSITPPPSPAVS